MSASTIAGPTPIPVLLYHSVTRFPAADGDPLSVGYAQFEEHLRAIADSGRIPLSVGEVARGLRGETDLPQRPVAISFDDGYANTPGAVGLALEYGMRASVFLTTGTLGRARMIGATQVLALAGTPDLVELGAHTRSHPRLDELGSAEARAQLAESKQDLEQLIGRGVDTFAYPYGSYDRRVRALVIAAGYRCAAAVKNAVSHPADDPWAIARYTVDARTSAARISEILEGRRVAWAWRRERARTRGYREVRRARRALSHRRYADVA